MSTSAENIEVRIYLLNPFLNCLKSNLKNIKDFVKETLTACTHFGVTSDEYLLKCKTIEQVNC